MATTSSTTQKKKETSLPPKRGQIKVQIFGNLIKKTVTSFVSKDGSGGNNRGDNGGSSASTTPPASAYNSDGNT